MNKQVALIYDVNTIFDAVDNSSRFQQSAQESLARNHGHPVYYSTTVLQTTYKTMVDKGADPEVLKQYLELLVENEDLDAEQHILTDVPVNTNYDIRDRYGRPDYEDQTVVSLADAAQQHSEMMPVLVTNDQPLTQWCETNGYTTITTQELQKHRGGERDKDLINVLHYTGTKIFPEGKLSEDRRLNTDPEEARQAVKEISSETAKPFQRAGRRLEAKTSELRDSSDPQNQHGD